MPDTLELIMWVAKFKIDFPFIKKQFTDFLMALRGDNG
jgi:hypothetical protein